MLYICTNGFAVGHTKEFAVWYFRFFLAEFFCFFSLIAARYYSQ